MSILLDGTIQNLHFVVAGLDKNIVHPQGPLGDPSYFDDAK